MQTHVPSLGHLRARPPGWLYGRNDLVRVNGTSVISIILNQCGLVYIFIRPNICFCLCPHVSVDNLKCTRCTSSSVVFNNLCKTTKTHRTQKHVCECPATKLQTRPLAPREGQRQRNRQQREAEKETRDEQTHTHHTHTNHTHTQSHTQTYTRTHCLDSERTPRAAATATVVVTAVAGGGGDGDGGGGSGGGAALPLGYAEGATGHRGRSGQPHTWRLFGGTCGSKLV